MIRAEQYGEPPDLTGPRFIARWLTVLTAGTPGRIGLALTLITLTVALAGPLAAPYSYTALGLILQNPTAGHLLGTDQLGRDVLSRVLYGGRSVIVLPALAVTLAFGLGGPLGLIAGYRGGRLEETITRTADILMSIPPLLLVMIFLIALGTSDRVLVLTTGIWFAPRIVRIVRAATAATCAKDYVLAARARGESMTSILWNEVTPNITGTLLAELALRLNYAIIFITTLNFLGLGVQPPSSDWGLMVSEGRAYLGYRPLIAIVPALMIGALAIGVNLISDQVAAYLARDVRTPASGRRTHSGRAGPQPASVDAEARPVRFRIRHLAVGYSNGGPVVPIVGDVAIDVRQGQITGLAGESGSGKTTAALSALGYFPPHAVLLGGEVLLDGQPLLNLPAARLRRVWASKISYVAQDATATLNPARRIGAQLKEVLSVNLGLSRAAAHEQALELLRAVRLPDPEGSLRRYPHEFSGGQLQRIAIAVAIAAKPEVVVFDEPTTGLDVTTNAEVIAMLNALIRSRGMAAIYVSHDLALLGAISDQLVVFYAGEVVESGPAPEVLRSPRHPYTRALIDALPSVRRPLRPRGIPGLPPGHVVADSCAFTARCGFADDRCVRQHPPLVASAVGHAVRCVKADELGALQSTAAQIIQPEHRRTGARLLEVGDLVCVYGRGRKRTTAVDHVSIDIREGEVVALVGESGSGKSTIGRALLGLLPPQAGTIEWRGRVLPAAEHRTPAQHREMQIIFQNPDSSLNPRHTVEQSINRAVSLFRPEVPRSSRPALVTEALREVQLDPSLAARYPHQLSGGQKQRVAMARAFVARPRLVVCDEIISGQDVSVQATILELVRTLQRDHGTALLFISHDLAAVRSIAQYVYVLQNGSVREEGPTEQLFDAPRDSYTHRLLQAVLEPDVSDHRRVNG